MIAEPRCFTRRCLHLLGVSETRDGEPSQVVVCPAFPRGIPDDILYGNNLHLSVDARQEGEVTYEKKEDDK